MRRPNVTTTRKWISEDEFYSVADLNSEVWLPLSSAKGRQLIEGYQISNKGRIKRDDHILHGTISEDGYHEVNLQCVDHSSCTVRVANLTLALFKGDPPASMQNPTCQHRNHDKLDNRIENLIWMTAFENNQEGHGVRVKILNDREDRIFPSQKIASEFLGRHPDYISECVAKGYTIKDADGCEVSISLATDGEWVEYHPAVPKNKRRCILQIDGVKHELQSLAACDAYLHKSQGYTANCVSHSWPIAADGCRLFLYDHSTCQFAEYVPTSRKGRSAANSCRLLLHSEEIEFSSVSKAARYIGRDPEYLRVCIRDKKKIVDSSGNEVVAWLTGGK